MKNNKVSECEMTIEQKKLRKRETKSNGYMILVATMSHTTKQGEVVATIAPSRRIHGHNISHSTN